MSRSRPGAEPDVPAGTEGTAPSTTRDGRPRSSPSDRNAPAPATGLRTDGSVPLLRRHAAALVDAVLASAGGGSREDRDADEMARALLTPDRGRSRITSPIPAPAWLGAMALLLGLEWPSRRTLSSPWRRPKASRSGRRAGLGPIGRPRL
jgi:hypothetical protein